jgi:hypothetical protein
LDTVVSVWQVGHLNIVVQYLDLSHKFAKQFLFDIGFAINFDEVISHRKEFGDNTSEIELEP